MRRSVVFLLAAALLGAGTAYCIKAHAWTAGYVFFLAVAFCLFLAGIAELIFFRKESRFWCSWARTGGVLGAALCLLNLALFDVDGVDPLLWIAATGTLVCFLFPLGYGKLQLLRGFFVPMTLAFGALLTWLCLLMLVNIPWFYPVTEPVEKLPERTAEQARDMDELLRLIPRQSDPDAVTEINGAVLAESAIAIGDKLKNAFEPDKLIGVDLTPIAEDLAKAEPGLNQLWTFLATHQPVAAPSLDPPHLSFVTIRTATQLECLAILWEAQQGKNFRPRLYRLLRGTKTVIGTEQGIVSVMFGSSLANYAASFLIPLSNRLDQPDAELIELIRENREKIPSAFRRALLVENTFQHNAINALNWERNPTEAFMALTTSEAFQEGSIEKVIRLFDLRRKHWPLYNERDTLRLLNGNLQADLAALDAPNIQARIHLFSKREAEAVDAASSGWKIINLTGRQISAWLGYGWNSSFLRAIATEARLAAFEQLLINKWNLTESPVLNPLTGNPFAVTPDGSIDILAGLPDASLTEIKPLIPPNGESVSL